MNTALKERQGCDVICQNHTARAHPEKDLYRICPSKLNKRELEDLYFALLENNLELKKTIHSQQEKLKMLNTKVHRMTSAQRNAAGKEKDGGASKALINEQKDTILELRKTNERLAERIRVLNMRLCSAKQFLKRSPSQNIRCMRCTTATTFKNSSMSALISKPSESNVKMTSTSCQHIKERDTSDTNDAQTETEEPENDGCEKQCNENKCRSQMDELKEKVVDLQEELSKAHKEYAQRISKLEDDVSALNNENIRVRATSQHEMDVHNGRITELRNKLNEAEANCNDLALQLTIEKRKVAELETSLKLATLSDQMAKTIEKLAALTQEKLANAEMPATNIPRSEGTAQNDAPHKTMLLNEEMSQRVSELQEQLDNLRDKADDENFKKPSSRNSELENRDFTPDDKVKTNDQDKQFPINSSILEVELVQDDLTNDKDIQPVSDNDRETPGSSRQARKVSINLNEDDNKIDTRNKINQSAISANSIEPTKDPNNKSDLKDQHNRFQIPGPIPVSPTKYSNSSKTKKDKKKKPQTDERSVTIGGIENINDLSKKHDSFDINKSNSNQVDATTDKANPNKPNFQKNFNALDYSEEQASYKQNSLLNDLDFDTAKSEASVYKDGKELDTKIFNKTSDGSNEVDLSGVRNANDEIYPESKPYFDALRKKHNQNVDNIKANDQIFGKPFEVHTRLDEFEPHSNEMANVDASDQTFDKQKPNGARRKSNEIKRDPKNVANDEANGQIFEEPKQRRKSNHESIINLNNQSKVDYNQFAGSKSNANPTKDKKEISPVENIDYIDISKKVLISDLNMPHTDELRQIQANSSFADPSDKIPAEFNGKSYVRQSVDDESKEDDESREENKFQYCLPHARICHCPVGPRRREVGLFRTCSGTLRFHTTDALEQFRNCACDGKESQIDPKDPTKPSRDSATYTKSPVLNINDHVPHDVNTYTLDKRDMATSPDNTDHEISSITDQAQEVFDTPVRDVLSPGEDKESTRTFTQTSHTDYGSLSEGELPTASKARSLSAGEKPLSKQISRRSSLQVEATLEAISRELERCRRLLVESRPQQTNTEPHSDEVPLHRATSSRRLLYTKPHTCVFTLHIGTLVLSDEAVLLSRDKSLVLLWQFYDQTMSMARVRTGRVVLLDLSTQYDVPFSEDFLNYLKHENMLLMICDINNQDEPIATCSLPLKGALLHTNRRADMSLALVSKTSHEELGVLDLWYALQAAPALRPRLASQIQYTLPKCQSVASYSSSNKSPADSREHSDTRLSRDIVSDHGKGTTLHDHENVSQLRSSVGSSKNMSTKYQQQPSIGTNTVTDSLQDLLNREKQAKNRSGRRLSQRRSTKVEDDYSFLRKHNTSKKDLGMNKILNSNKKTVKYTDALEEQQEPPVKLDSATKEDDQSIQITVLWLALNEECEAMINPNIKRLYVAYSFLGRHGAELETPVSLPKPKHYADKCFFDFKKTFQLHDADLPLLGHMSRCRAGRSAADPRDCIVFSVVSEPPEDPLGLSSCEDIGSVGGTTTMACATLAVIILHIFTAEAFFPHYPELKIVRDDGDLGEPLFLTPLLEAGNITEGRKLARVYLDETINVTSYAGFFTVNKTYNSNQFFWYFPAQNSNESAPVMVWLQGGPGGSSLFGLFFEHGPLRIKNGTLEKANYSWAINHHMIYIDNPVGTGFSFTQDDRGYCEEEVQVGNELYSTVTQFFQLFPDLQLNPFFIAGESYAGKYVPALAYTIHKKNPTAKVKINLNGMAIGNGWSDPIHQVNYSDYFYQLGLLDGNDAKVIKYDEAEVIKYIKLQKWETALKGYFELLNNLAQMTGFSKYYNFLHTADYVDMYSIIGVLRKSSFLRSIHVGNIKYHGLLSHEVYTRMHEDMMQSVAPWISELLDHYRLVIYNGQLDLIVPYPSTEIYLENLEFSSSDEYHSATRTFWIVDDDLAGFVKQAGNLTEILVRNAGHMVSYDQPEWGLDMITRFTHGKSYSDV